MSGGNLMVIAGPGAGKTWIIIGRMQHLIKNGVQADRILAVTFTNKAADEIKD
jgi:superfamily I DNA/RNA helicase